MRATISRALASLVLLSTAAAQDRPTNTEPAVTSPAGTVRFETGFEAIAGEPSYVTGVARTCWSGPLLRIVYSPADTVELDVEWIARLGVLGDDDRRGAASTEPGDATLRAKWRLRDGGDRGTTLAARFLVTLPQTSFQDAQFRPLGLGPDTLRAAVEGLLTRAVGAIRLHGNLGLYLADEVYRPHDQRDLLAYGLAVEWERGTRLTLLAEIAGRAGDGGPGTEARSELRFGLRLGSGRRRWDLAIRRGLAEADGTWGATAGLTWRIRPRG